MGFDDKIFSQQIFAGKKRSYPKYFLLIMRFYHKSLDEPFKQKQARILHTSTANDPCLTSWVPKLSNLSKLRGGAR